ncbi:adult cuticle protein 1-like [Condylostylus longicornis]|uniref:adult cuticle protein 1-like n=1 Tax=Condylostylus longicornis TaxID=2530218 RepID=UPI00244E0620|nr:adult cuticle protein 1-like [Condylostylus longicornis]
MKFVIAVVMLALVYGAQSSVVPLSYTAVHGPTLLAAAPAAPVIVASHPVATVLAAAPAPAAVAVHPVAVAAPVIAAEGTYVAQTRGAVHVAPLAGHANSASSVNLEPAPGTI